MQATNSNSPCAHALSQMVAVPCPAACLAGAGDRQRWGLMEGRDGGEVRVSGDIGHSRNGADDPRAQRPSDPPTSAVLSPTTSGAQVLQPRSLWESLPLHPAMGHDAPGTPAPFNAPEPTSARLHASGKPLCPPTPLGVRWLHKPGRPPPLCASGGRRDFQVGDKITSLREMQLT